MATNLGNCYEILSRVRRSLNEYSTEYVQETDTSGLYSNAFLLDQIIDAQSLLYAELMLNKPSLFFKETTITGVNSVFTLPPDFGRVYQFRDQDGLKVFPSSPSSIPTSGGEGSTRLYYRKGDTLATTKAGVSDTYTLYYYTEPRHIHLGQASAGAATSITLDSTYAPKLADFYNGMQIENITQDWVDTIDDYTSARVATISETAAASDWYGIVTDIPREFSHLIAPRAVLLAKERHPASQEKPGTSEIAQWQQDVEKALLAYGGEGDDVLIEDIWTDFNMQPAGAGINIPGQGYVIS